MRWVGSFKLRGVEHSSRSDDLCSPPICDYPALSERCDSSQLQNVTKAERHQLAAESKSRLTRTSLTAQSSSSASQAGKSSKFCGYPRREGEPPPMIRNELPTFGGRSPDPAVSSQLQGKRRCVRALWACVRESRRAQDTAWDVNFHRKNAHDDRCIHGHHG
jgi:hypothetical protein